MVESGSEAARVQGRRRLALGAVAALVAGASALAAPLAERVAQVHAAPDAVEAADAPKARAERLVWRGADVDGDGQADFVNPTGEDVRTTDAYGCGEFGASRDSGERRHEGVDFRAEAGRQILAPLSGFVTRIGYAYPGDTTLRFVEISNPALGYAARVFYVDPSVQLGQAVRLGAVIGSHHTLERKYPDGMTDHVHLEIIDRRGARIDPARLIVARLESTRSARG